MSNDLWASIVPERRTASARTATPIIEQEFERYWGGARVMKDYPDAVIDAGMDAVRGLDELESVSDFPSPRAAWGWLMEKMSEAEAIEWLTADPGGGWSNTASRRVALAPYPTATVNIDGQDVTVYAAPSNSISVKPWIVVDGRGSTRHEQFGGSDPETLRRKMAPGQKLIETGKYEWTKTPYRKVWGQHTAMAAPADLGVEVGSIFYSSWGYDQTNIDFYEVVGLTPQSVKVRMVRKNAEGGGVYGYKVTPRKGDFVGEVMTKRLSEGYRGQPAISINSYSSAWLWDGTPKTETDSQFGH